VDSLSAENEKACRETFPLSFNNHCIT